MFSACSAAWWALILALPGSTFETAEIYRYLDILGPEIGWAGLFGVISLWQFVGLVTHDEPGRSIAAFLAGVLWVMVAVMFFKGSPYSTQPGVYASLAMGCMWVIARGPSDDRQ